MKLQSHKDLIVWQRSIELVKVVYDISKCLPRTEVYGLCNQMQRAAVSIPSNIAEGYARKGTNEYVHFLSISCGSAAELETQLIIVNQEYLSVKTSEAERLLAEVQKMLSSLMSKLKTTKS